MEIEFTQKGVLYTNNCFCLNPTMMKDYAYPTMMAERALKELHDAVLSKKWDKAEDKAIETIRWVVDIQDALSDMRKRDEA